MLIIKERQKKIIFERLSTIMTVAAPFFLTDFAARVFTLCFRVYVCFSPSTFFLFKTLEESRERERGPN